MERNLGKLFTGLIKAFLLLTVVMLIALPSSTFAKGTSIKTMTRNLYLGADIFKVVDAAQEDPNSIPYAVADVYNTMLYTNFWERAEALADEIALYEPDVVGLQEVSTYEKTTPSDLVMAQLGVPPELWSEYQSTELVIDFYTELNEALKERGMYYTAYTVTNADIEMPMVDPTTPYGLSDVRLVDHDVILVREDHVVSRETKGNYAYQLSLDLATTNVAFTRGYVAVDVNIRGNDFHFVNTHLEVRSCPNSIFRFFQAAQMRQLLTILSEETLPIVLVGDFNSGPEDATGLAYPPEDIDEFCEPLPGKVGIPYVSPYMQAVHGVEYPLPPVFPGAPTFPNDVNASYVDSWTKYGKGRSGFTSGFDEYVSDPKAELTSRIDLILTNIKPDKVKVVVVGDKKSDMTPSGLWPSDHAGVVANIIFEK